jgi:hypothetical protein
MHRMRSAPRLGVMVHEGAQHTQRTRRLEMVTFGVHIREKRHTTKEGMFEQQGEKDQLCDSEADLDEEGRAPSRSQVTLHGRTCCYLKVILWIELGRPSFGLSLRKSCYESEGGML